MPLSLILLTSSTFLPRTLKRGYVKFKVLNETTNRYYFKKLPQKKLCPFCAHLNRKQAQIGTVSPKDIRRLTSYLILHYVVFQRLTTPPPKGFVVHCSIQLSYRRTDEVLIGFLRLRWSSVCYIL